MYEQTVALHYKRIPCSSEMRTWDVDTDSVEAARCESVFWPPPTHPAAPPHPTPAATRPPERSATICHSAPRYRPQWDTLVRSEEPSLLTNVSSCYRGFTRSLGEDSMQRCHALVFWQSSAQVWSGGRVSLSVAAMALCQTFCCWSSWLEEFRWFGESAETSCQVVMNESSQSVQSSCHVGNWLIFNRHFRFSQIFVV